MHFGAQASAVKGAPARASAPRNAKTWTPSMAARNGQPTHTAFCRCRLRHREQALVGSPPTPSLGSKHKDQVPGQDLQIVSRVRHHVACFLIAWRAVKAQGDDPAEVLTAEEGAPQLPPSAVPPPTMPLWHRDLPEQRLAHPLHPAVVAKNEECLHHLYSCRHVGRSRKHRAEHHGSEDLARCEARAVQELVTPAGLGLGRILHWQCGVEEEGGN
mmetsp:Transcript_49412/g.158096  ORF Transcript_49412/g.158096 Transcript_49412/m.158096 type:complete len:215 (+) Transcript_49412:280-924(+)